MSLGERQPATPQRPTVSSDTATAAPNTLELETGVAWDPDDSTTTPNTLRYGYDETTELFVGWSPLVHVQFPGPDETGVGDVALGARHRLLEEGEAPSVAVQGTVKLPTADETKGLGSGELDVSVAGIATKSFETASLTAFYSLDVLGQPTGSSDIGHTFALAGGIELVPGIGGFAELDLISIPEQDLELGFVILGATYALESSHIFDTAVVVGLDSDAPDFQLVVGFTRNFGSLVAAPASRRSYP